MSRHGVAGLASPPAEYLPAASSITEQLLNEYPDLLKRYGERAREFGTHDTAYQIAWVANAVRCDNPALLRRDILWLRDLLLARGFPLDPLRRNLELVAQSCREMGLTDDEDLKRLVAPILDELAS